MAKPAPVPPSSDPVVNARSAMERILGDFSDTKTLRKAEAEARAMKKARAATKAKRAKP